MLEVILDAHVGVRSKTASGVIIQRRFTDVFEELMLFALNLKLFATITKSLVNAKLILRKSVFVPHARVSTIIGTEEFWAELNAVVRLVDVHEDKG